MPNRSRIKKPRDLNLLAAAIVSAATGDVPLEESDERDPHAVALGKKGGAKGGPARAAKLSPERRREIAQQAARARWGNGRMTMARRSQAAFFKGVGRVFDLSGALSRGHRSSFAADGQALRSDWSAIGHDLSDATHRAQAQVSKGSAWRRSDGKPVSKPKQLRLIQ